MADDSTLVKVLFYDIIRQTRRPAGLASVDADICFDRIAHPIASTTFQAFGIPTPAIRAMLSTIQDMRFYLRTGFGNSKNYSGSNKSNPMTTQGMCQGNTASTVAWTVTSISMIRAHRQKGHGAHLVAPISGKSGQLIGRLFLDDNDLFHVDIRSIAAMKEAQRKFKESVTNCGRLLIATGGALQPSKCSYYMLSFKWNSQGQLSYKANHTNNNMSITVLISNSPPEEIQHLVVNDVVKTLGCMTCPAGDE